MGFEFQDLVQRTIQLHAAPSAAPGGGPAGAQWPDTRRLNFELWHQDMDNWCWAAVSSAIGNYYDGRARWSQCGVASRCLTEACCPPATPCDRGWYLELGLADVQHPATLEWPLDISQIQQHINAETPIGVRIQWPDPDKGHFIVIEGYDRTPDGDVIYVEDPWTGSHNVDSQELNEAYDGKGRWSHTYLTTP